MKKTSKSIITYIASILSILMLIPLTLMVLIAEPFWED